MNEEINFEKFRIEFRELLNKYGACVGCLLEGDTRGVSAEISVDFGSKDKYREYKLTDGNSVDASDLKD